MEYEKIILSFIPVIIFLLIYKRYFLSRGSVTKYITSLLTGICYALFLLLSGGLVADLMYIMNPLVRGFIMAGLLEKAGAVIAIYVLLKKFPGFTISEGISFSSKYGASPDIRIPGVRLRRTSAFKSSRLIFCIRTRLYLIYNL